MNAYPPIPLPRLARVAYASEIAGAADATARSSLAGRRRRQRRRPGANAGSTSRDGGTDMGLPIDDRWHAFAKTPGAADPAKNADYAAGMLSG